MYYDNYDPQALWAALGTYIACIFFFALVIFGLMIWLYWRVLSKAGYNGAWALLMLIPGINTFVSLGILLVLAFGDWPALRRPAYAPAPPAYQPPVAPPPPASGAAFPGYSTPVAPAPQAAPPVAPMVAPVEPPVAPPPDAGWPAPAPAPAPAPEAPAPAPAAAPEVPADVEPPAPPAAQD